MHARLQTFSVQVQVAFSCHCLGTMSESPQKNGLVFGRFPVEVAGGIIVTGGMLRKAWPILNNEEGHPVISLSSNNYDLAMFLFGKVNKKGGRALLSHGEGAKFIRRVWRARNAAQESALLQLTTTDVECEDAVPAEIKKGKKRIRRRPEDDPMVWGMVPQTLPIEVESLAFAGKILRFVAIKGHPNSCPSVVATKEVLQALSQELRPDGLVDSANRSGGDVSVQNPGRSSSGVDPFSSPPQKKRKRHVLPYGGSPDVASSTGGRSSSGKKNVSTAVHFMKDSRRVSVRYRDWDGTAKYKYFPVDNPDNEKEVEKVTKMAEAFLKAHHHRPSQ